MVLGIDIGGTNTKFGIIDKNYRVQQKYSIATENKFDDTYFIKTIIEKVKEIKKEVDFDRICVGSPGIIDSVNGVAIRAANLPYDNTPIVDMMQSEMDVHVKLANDAECAVYGEIYAGMGKKYDDFLMLTLGTGVGGGIVLNGKPYAGKCGRAGEFGHMIISHGGNKCGCGKRGCYEQYASVTALINQTREAIKHNPESLLAKMGVGGVSGKTAFDAKRAGCPVGNAVVEKYTEYISAGIESLSTIFQPEAVVIGGAISNEKNYLTDPINKKITCKVDVVVSELKNDAGIIGAAAIANKG